MLLELLVGLPFGLVAFWLARTVRARSSGRMHRSAGFVILTSIAVFISFGMLSAFIKAFLDLRTTVLPGVGVAVLSWIVGLGVIGGKKRLAAPNDPPSSPKQSTAPVSYGIAELPGNQGPAAMHRDQRWFYEKNDLPIGPVTKAKCEELIVAGEIVRGTLVWCEGHESWVPAEASDLARVFEEVPPPLPPIPVR